MATVFANSMTAHVWANQSQDSGRSHNGNLFFEGPALYSYGRHFVVGYVMPDGVTLLNADKYSPSTSQHQSYAWHAVRGRSYHVPALTDLVNSWALRAMAKEGAARTEGRDRLLSFVEKHVLQMTDESAAYLLSLFSLEKRLPKIRAAAEKARDKEKAAEKARELQALADKAKRLAGMTDSAFNDWLSEKEKDGHWGRLPIHPGSSYTQWRKARPSESLAGVATGIRRLQRAAKQACGKRVQATLAARLKVVAARSKDLAKWESHGEELARFMTAKRDARRLWALRMESGPLSRARNLELKAFVEYVAKARPGLISDKGLETLAAIVRNCDELERQAVERETVERMAREAKDRADWLAGGGNRWTRLSDVKGGPLLRARDVERDESGVIIGGKLETSHGADVPLLHALKAFAFVRRVVASGKPWHKNGHCIRVGHFQIDSIDTAGTMKAGCHTIHLAEMDRVAALLGVADIAPSDSALELSKGAA